MSTKDKFGQHGSNVLNRGCQVADTDVDLCPCGSGKVMAKCHGLPCECGSGKPKFKCCHSKDF